MKKIILLVGLAIVLMATLVTVYFIFIKQPTSAELYRAALSKVLRTESKEAYVSFNVDSGDTKLEGEFKGNLNGENERMRADVNVSSTIQGIPVNIAAETIAIKENDKTNTYVKYKSMTSSNKDYNQTIVNYFSPVINKWANLDNDTKEDTPTGFENDGSAASLSVAGIFVPIGSFSKNDRKIYLSAVDKYNLYQTDEKVEKVQFKGIEARKLEINITKDAFKEFDKEVSQSLSKETKYERFENTFTDQLFGKGNNFSANVYINSEGSIIGVDLVIDLDAPVKEKSFNTTLNRIDASLLIEYNRKLTIDAPKGAITQQEYNALLGI